MRHQLLHYARLVEKPARAVKEKTDSIEVEPWKAKNKCAYSIRNAVNSMMPPNFGSVNLQEQMYKYIRPPPWPYQRFLLHLWSHSCMR